MREILIPFYLSSPSPRLNPRVTLPVRFWTP